MWRFRTYLNDGGKGVVQKSIDGLSDKGREMFKAQLRYLASTSTPEDWHEPHAKKMHGYAGMYEIRFRDGNRQQRALGYFGPGPDDFTIVMLCSKKQNDYDPHSALNTADSRRAVAIFDPKRSACLQVDGEDFPAV